MIHNVNVNNKFLLGTQISLILNNVIICTKLWVENLLGVKEKTTNYMNYNGLIVGI